MEQSTLEKKVRARLKGTDITCASLISMFKEDVQVLKETLEEIAMAIKILEERIEKKRGNIDDT